MLIWWHYTAAANIAIITHYSWEHFNWLKQAITNLCYWSSCIFHGCSKTHCRFSPLQLLNTNGTEHLLLTNPRATCHPGLKTVFFLSVYVYYGSAEVQQTFVFCRNFSLVVHYFHNFHPQYHRTYSDLHY